MAISGDCGKINRPGSYPPEQKNVDSYVVHIYRRPDKNDGKLVGLVERIGDGERKAFRDERELLACLALDVSKKKSGPGYKGKTRNS